MTNEIGAAAELRQIVVICNKRGLHARASASFVRLAETFDAEISVSREGHTVPGTSIVGLLTLGASPGSEIEILSRGPEATQALAAMVELVERGFDEDQLGTETG